MQSILKCCGIVVAMSNEYVRNSLLIEYFVSDSEAKEIKCSANDGELN